MNNKITVAVLGVAAIAALSYLLFFYKTPAPTPATEVTPEALTVAGTFECLAHLDTSGPQTEECAFGIQSETGEHYALDFWQPSVGEQFRSGARVQVDGFFAPKETLSTDQWKKYDMKGVLTVVHVEDTNSATNTSSGGNAKINISAVCEGVLAYMTFPDAASANTYIADCKAGEHPEVIEQYKASLNLDGAAI